MIGERAPGAELPLLLFHDVCWPHGRRDDYFAPEPIPERYRQPRRGRRGRASSRASPACARAACPTRARRPARAGRATAC